MRTLARVQGATETLAQAQEDARRLAQQGVKTLVFPNAEMLRLFRLRLAALA